MANLTFDFQEPEVSEYFKTMVKEYRTDENAFHNVVTTLIHMEEAENNISAQNFDLQNIKVLSHNRPDQRYKIEINVRMSQMFVFLFIHYSLFIIFTGKNAKLSQGTRICRWIQNDSIDVQP